MPNRYSLTYEQKAKFEPRAWGGWNTIIESIQMTFPTSSRLLEMLDTISSSGSAEFPKFLGKFFKRIAMKYVKIRADRQKINKFIIAFTENEEDNIRIRKITIGLTTALFYMFLMEPTSYNDQVNRAPQMMENPDNFTKGVLLKEAKEYFPTEWIKYKDLNREFYPFTPYGERLSEWLVTDKIYWQAGNKISMFLFKNRKELLKMRHKTFIMVYLKDSIFMAAAVETYGEEILSQSITLDYESRSIDAIFLKLVRTLLDEKRKERIMIERAELKKHKLEKKKRTAARKKLAKQQKDAAKRAKAAIKKQKQKEANRKNNLFCKK